MVKAVGAALIVVACAGLGFQVALSYRDRPKHLADLANGLRQLKAEIEYNLTPLPQALLRVARRLGRPIDVVFASASEQLGQGDSVTEAFALAVDKCRQVSALNREDLDVLQEFARTLGTSDLEHQSQYLDGTLARLATLEREARELQRKNERMWQYLGVLTGLLIIIILY